MLSHVIVHLKQVMLPLIRSRAATARSVPARFFSLSSEWGDGASRKNGNNSESADDFERRIFGAAPEGDPSGKGSSFFDKLGGFERVGGMGRIETGDNRRGGDGFGEVFTTLNDGLDRKLKKAAASFVRDEMFEDGYKYRPDVTFFPGLTYDVKDLDLTKPVIQKFPPRKGFYTSTEEALRKADFRNVRYLANFITEAGIIIKRSKTSISAKAQRKIAREIKTARAFGLMPFISMGTKPFSFGRSAKESDLTLQFADYNSNQLHDTSYDTKDDPADL